MTTQLLERAFAEAAKLPVREQDALATFVLEEMEAEKSRMTRPPILRTYWRKWPSKH